MKILVIHASAGAGHQKAAEAIYQGLQKTGQHQVFLADALDYTPPLFKKMYQGTYSFMITKVPFIWKFVFNTLDRNSLQKFIRKARRIYNGINTKGLQWYLRDEKFDCIISTHFMSVEVVSALKEQGLIRSKLICVVTDFDVHKIWLAKNVDKYAVACDWTKDKVKQLGVEDSKIFSTGIPTNDKFSEPHDISGLKSKLGLTQNDFTVLIATGSFGIGPIEEIIEALKDIQTIVVCGHNKGLYERLSKKRLPLTKVLGLVNNMHELMAISNVMVTKPGGLSIAEALVSQLPMIFFNAIPGQEENNIKVLKIHGIGLSNCSIKEIVQKINEFKTSKDQFLTALKNTQTLARPFAGRDIINLIQ